MDDLLKNKQFDPIVWINSNLNLNRVDSLEGQLTELTFHLQNYQSELESSITTSKESIEFFLPQLESELDVINDDYDYIGQFIRMNFGEIEMQKLKTNDSLFEEINEKDLFRWRITNTLEIFENIISIDFHIDEAKKNMENQDIIRLEKKMVQLEKTLLILAKLPLIHPLHEKVEGLIEIMSLRLKNSLYENLKKNLQLADPTILLILKTCQILRLEQMFVDIYEDSRILIKVNEIIQDISCMNGIQQICQRLEFLLLEELEQLRDFHLIKFQWCVTQIITKLLRRIVPNFSENIFFVQYLNTSNDEQIKLFETYLLFVKRIEECIESILTREEDFISICATLYNPILSTRQKILKREIINIKNQVRYILKGYEDKENVSEKIGAIDLVSLLGMMENSFARTYECTLGLEIENWIYEFQIEFQPYIDMLFQLVQEVDSRLPKNSLIEKIFDIDRSGNFQSKRDVKYTSLGSERMDFNMSQFVNLLDICLKKYEEILMIESSLLSFNKRITNLILEDKFMNPKIRKLQSKMQNSALLQDELLKTNFSKFQQQLQNGIFLFERVAKSINEVELKIKKIILKIMLGECQNLLIQYPNDKIWLASNQIKEEIQQFSPNPSEYIHPLSQNFFGLLQILEQVMNTSSKRGIQNISELYLMKIESQSTTEINIFQSGSDKKVTMVIYWASLFSQYLLKIYKFYVESIEECNYNGLLQLKSDIEYLIGILQSFKFLGKITEFDSFLKNVDAFKQTEKIIPKDLFQTYQSFE